jgi:hypothetical protein
MKGTSSWWFIAFSVAVAGCGAGETKVDPGDLELRDLLGVAPEVAVTWDADQRAAARRVLVDGLRERAEALPLVASDGAAIDDRVTRAIATLDAARAEDGDSALGVVRLTVGPREITALARTGDRTAAVAEGGAAPITELWLAEQWDEHAWAYLPGRGLDVLSAIAVDAGHQHGAVVIAPASRLGAIAGYVATESPPRLVVNPIVLAALEPDVREAATVAAMDRPPGTARIAPEQPPAKAPEHAPIASTGGNPYSFYGSVSECAYAQRLRCESCLTNGSCEAVTDAANGNEECDQLALQNGRGYFLLCINLSLAITSVDECTKDKAPSCPRDQNASSSLGAIEANHTFLDDPTCGTGLDACLAKIYGAPNGQFPTVDGGTIDPGPPRNTSLDCGDGCSSNNNNCESSPSCDCSGPSCNNSFSCDSACSSSNDQSGCGGNCDGCSSSSGGGGGGGGCSSGSGGSSSSGDSCSSGGGGCGGSGGGCSGGGGGGCGGGGGGCSGGGGSSNGCNVAPQSSSAGFALALSLSWAFLPIPVAAAVRRRSKKKKPKTSAVEPEVAS